MAAHIGEQLDVRVKLRAGLGAEQFDGAGIALDVQVEAGFDLQSQPAVKTDERGGEVLHIVLKVASLGGGNPSLFAAGTVAAKVIVGHTEGRHRLRAAGEIADKIHHMHAEVNERTAAAVRLVTEPPARTAVAAEVVGLGIIEVAHRPAVEEGLHHLGVPSEAADEADHQHLAGLVGSLLHLLGLKTVHRHRLLTDDVGAGLQRGDGRILMLGVPRAEEADAASDAGLCLCGLGRRILRTETASGFTSASISL